MPQPIAILVSDIHLSHKPPIFRSNEPDWYEAMARQLMELCALQLDYNVPIVCAGDIFDKWNSPAELINFAMENLPEMYAIPGQHDLPSHRLDLIEKSAYWSLELSQSIKDLGTRPSVRNNQLALFPFPWGNKIEKPDSFYCKMDCLKLAVVHSYIWQDSSSGYIGAPHEKLVSNYDLDGFDFVVFGDNHKGFTARRNGQCSVMNCGTFFVRKSDEADYKPMAGILYEDARITPYYFDTSKDVYLEMDLAQKVERVENAFSGFIDQLQSLGLDSLDFEQAVKNRLDFENVSTRIREAVMEAFND